jgi:CRP/FNR family transcriptional regulator, cyclic AMP receptor protein
MSEASDPSTSLQMFPPGAVLIPEGGKLGTLFVLREGQLEVVREGRRVSLIGQRGSIVGEMSVLLNSPHTATVRAITPVEVFVIPDAIKFLETRPLWTLQLARLLAQRLNVTTAALIDREEQLTGVEHPHSLDFRPLAEPEL